MQVTGVNGPAALLVAEAIMSTETFLQTIWATVWAYVQPMLPTELTGVARSGDLLMWALAALVVVGGLLLLGSLAGE